MIGRHNSSRTTIKRLAAVTPALLRRHVMTVAVTALVVAIVRKAWLDLDLAWDSLAYHLPLAAIRAGVVSEQQYHLSSRIRQLYDGFPILPEYMEGMLWRITSRPQAANFIGLIGLTCLVLLLLKVFRIPARYSLLAFLSIPIVLIQTTSSYVDLFGNCFVTIMLLLLFVMFLSPEAVSRLHIGVFFAAVCIALNTKTLYIPVTTAALAAFACVAYCDRSKLITVREEWRKSSHLMRVGMIALSFALVGAGYFNEIKNLVRFGNPVYPANIDIGPVHFKGTFSEGNEPEYLAHSLHSTKWLLSVLEYKAFEGRNPLWTNSQGDVPESSPAARMGGFFSPLVLFNVLWFCLLQTKLRRRFGWKPSYFMLLLTVFTSTLPASQESRYYMYWLLCLISINLFLVTSGLKRWEQTNAKIVFLGTMASFLVFVLCSTDFVYIRRRGWSTKRVVASFGIEGRLSAMHLRSGEAVCVLGKDRTTFLYAPSFNPALASGTHYRVMEAYNLDDCEGARIVP
jgi:hypothetical protein